MNGDLPPEVWATRDVAATLNLNDLGSESRAVELVVTPLAIRGREGGANLEIGPEGGPYNALRAGDGGSSRSSRSSLVSITGPVTHSLTAEGHDASEDGSGRGTPIIAATLTTGGAPNSNPPGRRAEDDVNLVAFQPQAAGDNALSIDVTAPCLSKSQLAGVVDSRQLTETTVRRLTPVECERLQGFPDNHTATSNGKTQADSPRYKQMGNAVAVPVFDWVFGRIDAVERGVL